VTARWDHLPLVARGHTGEVRRDGARAIKVAHPLPEARLRLSEEAKLHRALQRAGLPVPALLAASRSGRYLIRRWVDGTALPAQLTPRLERELLELRLQLEEQEHRLGVRLDFSPSNLLLTSKGVMLLDGGRRLAAPRFTSGTVRGFSAEWRRWFANPSRARLLPPSLPPSGRFHVETPLGHDPGAKLLWLNDGLVKRLGLRWPRELFAELGHWSSTEPAVTTRPSTRYTDMVGLNLRTGPRGDGRVVLLGQLPTALGTLEVAAKGIGPTPLAWKGRAFHEDGRVSFPRTLWEVTAADELARLGFDTPEYLCVVSSAATTVDNTGRRWPAAVGVRVAKTHWRLGHLRAVMHDRERFRALVTHLGQGEPAAWLRRFCAALGADVGRADALQIHCFNATPGNVRIDGHLIDYSTVRFHRHYLPQFRFLEGVWTINRTRAVWSQQAQSFAEILCTGGALPRGQLAAFRKRALHDYLKAYERGALAGFALAFGFDAARVPASLARRFVAATLALRMFRSEDEVHFEFFDQRCPAPRFDLLGKAPEVVRAVARGHRAPWEVLQRDEAPLSREELTVARRWVALLAEVVRFPAQPPRRWSELIRPWLEPETLAALLYGRSTPRSFRVWQQRLSQSTGLPEGRHGYGQARRLALARGHLELVTLAGTREVIVGLSPALSHQLERTLRRIVGPRLVGVVVHGSRVVERRELRRRVPLAFSRGDLRAKGRDGVKEFGPSREASSDLDLKVFIRPGLSVEAHATLERKVASALAALGAWFPLGSWPRQRLLPTRHLEIDRAFRAWNGPPRKKLLGKDPIPEVQAAVLFPRERGEP
jgi:hypothetical protein